MITDMMTAGFHGAEPAEVKYGDTVAVFGIGPAGLMVNKPKDLIKPVIRRADRKKVLIK